MCPFRERRMNTNDTLNVSNKTRRDVWVRWVAVFAKPSGDEWRRVEPSLPLSIGLFVKHLPVLWLAEGSLFECLGTVCFAPRSHSFWLDLLALAPTTLF